MDKIHTIRHEFEQSILVKAFQKRRASLLSALMQRRESFLLDYYKQVELKEPHYQCPYDPADFSVSISEFKQTSHSVLIARLGMPEPTQQLDCRSVYLCFGSEGSCDLYITVERSETGEWTIYRWQGSNKKTLAHTSNNEEFDQVLAIYWEVNADHAKL